MCAEAGHAHVPPEGHVEAVSSSARWGCCGKMRPLDNDGSDGGCGGCGGGGGDGGGGGVGNAGGDAFQSSSRRSDVSRISWSEIGHGSNGRAQNGAPTGGIARSSNACTLVLLNAYLIREAIRQAISGNQVKYMHARAAERVPDEGGHQAGHQWQSSQMHARSCC